MNNIEDLSHSERLMVMDGLKSYLGYGDNTHVPGIDQFIEDDYYLGKITDNGRKIYPKWREVLRQLYPTPYGCKYHTIYLASATGTGKSVIGDIICAYNMAKVILMEDPHGFYGLLPTKDIELFFYGAQSHVIKAIKAPFLTLIEQSPFFKSNIMSTGKSLKFKNKISISSGSDVIHNVSRDIIFSRLEELHQEKGPGQTKRNYDSLVARVVGRFQLSNGLFFNAGVLLVSSPGDDAGFSTALLKRAEDDPGFFVFQSPQWEILSARKQYSKQTFKVFIGSDNVDAYIVEDDLDYRKILERGEDHLVLEVPMDYYDKFRSDIYIAIRDIAGIVSKSKFTYLTNTPKINEMFIKSKRSLFRAEIIMMSFYDTTPMIEYVDRDVLKSLMNTDKKYFLSIDIGVTGDLAGMSMCHIESYVRNERYDEEGRRIVTLDPWFLVDFSVGIKKSNSNDEVAIFKFRDFILDLKKRGVNIQGVACDGYQSTQLLQEIKFNKIPSKLISVDRTKVAYDTLKSAVYTGRVHAPLHEKCKDEMKNLVLVKRRNKWYIDHPASNSKDISDSLASCIYNAYLNRDRSFTLLDGFVNKRSNDSRMELLSDEERIFQKSLDNGDGWKVVSSSDSLIL